jgi:hypothetical protein
MAVFLKRAFGALKSGYLSRLRVDLNQYGNIEALSVFLSKSDFALVISVLRLADMRQANR